MLVSAYWRMITLTYIIPAVVRGTAGKPARSAFRQARPGLLLSRCVLEKLCVSMQAPFVIPNLGSWPLKG
jgi:hypothetical protein